MLHRVICIFALLCALYHNAVFAATGLLWSNPAAEVVAYQFNANNLPVYQLTSLAQLNNHDWQLAASADLNGDQQTDLLWRHRITGENYIHLLQHGQRQRVIRLNQVADQHWQVIATGDLDGNGQADVLWRHQLSGALYVYLMQVDMHYLSGALPPLSKDLQVITLADFDRDGKADLLLRHRQTGHNSLYLMNGTTVKSVLPINQVKDPNWYIAAVADFNGDGWQDLWWRHRTTGLNVLYQMQRQHIQAIQPINQVTPDWQLSTAADFNQDGQADVVWRHRHSGYNYLYLMQGAAIAQILPINQVSQQDWQIKGAITMQAADTTPKVNGVAELNGDTVKVSWTAVAGATHYHLYWRDDVTQDWQQAHKISDITTPYSFTIPQPNRPYQFLLVAEVAALEQVISSPMTLSHQDKDLTTLSRPYDTSQTQASVAVQDTIQRQYQFNTDLTLRDQAAQQRVVNEDPQQMYIRSGHPFFDGLFAMAIDDAWQNHTDTTNGGGFLPQSCDCFLTGAKWQNVWTRDTAYAADLGLAQLAPEIMRNSLQFKLSPLRDQPLSTSEIVQDTGTGGSWPVSTDRGVWAMGAQAVWPLLNSSDASAFKSRAYQAMRNTIERDRLVVFDAIDGLYRGEQSFLDWRKQSYPSWTGADISPYTGNGTVHIGMSKSLSTNITHYALLHITAQLAESYGDTTLATTYQQWASDLKQAINQGFWQEDVGLYSSLRTTQLDLSATHKYDLLGLALAILWDIASAEQATRILQNYPHTVAGAPVIWPQQPDTVIYHNGAIWPFVSAYTMKAAKKMANTALLDHHLQSLVLGSALNLSNMENYHYLTLDAGLEDYQPTTPQINSQRQLWSVGGYVGMVTDVIFGRQLNEQGLQFHPMLTANMLQNWFYQRSQISLYQLQYQGRTLDIHLHRPTIEDNAAYYQGVQWLLNDQLISGQQPISANQLQADHNRLDILLSGVQAPASHINLISGTIAEHTAPAEPVWPDQPVNFDTQHVTLSLPTLSNDQSINIYRNGMLAASGITSDSWQDSNIFTSSNATPCYTLEAVNAQGLYSHHSEPRCAWQDATIFVFSQEQGDLESPDNATASTDHDRGHYANWGEPDQQLQVSFTPQVSGDYFVSLHYGNHHNNINTGITAVVKQLDLIDANTQQTLDSAVLFMPHLDDWSAWGESNFAAFHLQQGQTYQLILRDYFNMSYLAFFENYDRTGGVNGPVNQANISWLKILRMNTL